MTNHKLKPRLFAGLVIALGLSCTWSTTRELLDLTFMDSVPRKFQITSPSVVETGTPFAVTVIYIDSNGNKSAGRFAKYLNWSVVGAGSVSQVSEGLIASGIYQATLIYSNSALSVGQSVAIQFSVSDPGNASVNGKSGVITGRYPVTVSTYKFSTPTLAYQSVSFSVTISAIGNDGNVKTDYNGTVNLTPTVTGLSVPDGTLTPATATFVNGVVTLSNIQYTKPAGSLYVNATDVSDSAKTGKSSPIQIAGDAFSVGAIPTDVDVNSIMDSVRVSWTPPQNAFVYKVYRQTSPGVFTLTNTVFAPTTSGVDNDVSLTLGTTYTYKVEARDSVGNLLKEAMTSVVFKNCTAMPTTMNADTNFTINNSPYCLTGGTDATISNAGTAVTLTIDPGVVMLFGASRQLIIGQNAMLKSEGTQQYPITYTSSAISPVAPAWQGVLVASTAINGNVSVNTISGEAVSESKGTTGTSIAYSTFEYSNLALSTARSLYIDNSMYRSNKNTNCAGNPGGIYVNGTAAADWVVVKSSAFVSNQKTSCGGGGTDIMLAGNGHLYAKLNTSVNAVVSSNADGGAFQLNGSGQSTFYGNSIYYATNNNAAAGISIYSNGATQHFIKNNYFNGTNAATFGGAISAGNGSQNEVIQYNTFENTYANQGGAIYMCCGGNNISYNIFKGTYAKSNGGAIMIESGATSNTIYSNIFVNTYSNSISGGGHGGAIYLAGTNTSSNISNNSIYGSYAAAGGSALGGAVYLATGSSGVVMGHNNIKDTWASSGGGGIAVIGTTTSLLTISQNTFNNTRKISAAGSLNGLYNTEDTGYTVSNNWWGSDYSGTSACQTVAANLCESTVASIPALTNASTAWPLCCAAPSDPNCVGATTLPSYQACQ